MEKKLIATRDGLGDELVELGGKNKNIYVVDADIGKSCKTTKFAKTFPEHLLLLMQYLVLFVCVSRSDRRSVIRS